jgi:hypothetical protein
MLVPTNSKRDSEGAAGLCFPVDQGGAMGAGGGWQGGTALGWQRECCLGQGLESLG